MMFEQARVVHSVTNQLQFFEIADVGRVYLLYLYRVSQEYQQWMFVYHRCANTVGRGHPLGIYPSGFKRNEEK